jgi:hypothetical protein
VDDRQTVEKKELTVTGWTGKRAKTRKKKRKNKNQDPPTKKKRKKKGKGNKDKEAQPALFLRGFLCLTCSGGLPGCWVDSQFSPKWE